MPPYPVTWPLALRNTIAEYDSCHKEHTKIIVCVYPWLHFSTLFYKIAKAKARFDSKDSSQTDFLNAAITSPMTTFSVLPVKELLLLVKNGELSSCCCCSCASAGIGILAKGIQIIIMR